MRRTFAVLFAALAFAGGSACPSPRPPKESPTPRAADGMPGGTMKTARAALDRHLQQRQPGVAFDVEPYEATAPGYSFFEAQQEDVHDGGLQYFAVRGDSVLAGDPAADLSQIFRALGVVERFEAQSADNLARIGTVLLGRDTRLLDADGVARFAPDFEGDALRAPVVERAGDGAKLVFWVRSLGRGLYFTRFEVSVAKDYQVSVRSEQPTLKRKGG